jgi:mRNA interferase RelE/StbE
MNHKIVFIPEAVADYKKLDGSVKKIIHAKLEALKENLFLGKPLGNKHGIDLTGFYKLYANEKKYRIVYRILGPKKIEILEIWGIGKRDKAEIYKLIHSRRNT